MSSQTPFAGTSSMAARMRALDWTRTALGPVERWPQSLRTAVSIILPSGYPMFVWWGPSFVNLHNDAYIPVLGEKDATALGRPAAEIWSEIWPVVGPLAERALAGEGTFFEDLPLFMRRHGYLEETYFSFSYSPIRDETGGVGGMFCACSESTGKILGGRRLKLLRELSLVAAEAQDVRQVRRRLAETLEGGRPDVAFALLHSVAADGGTTFLEAANAPAGAIPAGLPLQGAASGEERLVPDLPRAVGRFESGWDEPVASAVALAAGRADSGADRTVATLGVNPRRALDDDYMSFLRLVASSLGAALDGAQAREEERRRADALAEIDRAKTTFFSNVSHEFRTPLTLLLGPLEDEIAAARSGAKADPERLEIAHRNALRLLKLVNAMLDFSRIEAGRLDASYEPTDLAAYTADLASSFRSACDKAGLALVVDCPPLGEAVFVDRDMWERIVLNLVSNAFKFTMAGEIAVRLRHEAGAAVLVVSDTGIGVPERELPRLFDRFQRVEGARGRTQEGAGIGLALVQELTRLHGGQVGVESAVGRGSVFTVSLPLGSAHLPADRVRPARAEPSAPHQAHLYLEEALRWLPDDAEETAAFEAEAEPGEAAEAGGARRPLVLVAEDNADMRGYLRRLLGRAYRLRMAADGAEALAELRRGARPDLLLSDVMMPELDGFGLVREVRADPRLADLPVILLSARAGEEASIDGLRAGADDYLVKPFAARELLARVAGALDRSRLRAEIRESEIRFRNMADHAPMMIWVTDADGRCVYLNARWREFTGQGEEEGLAYGWLDCVHPEDRPRAQAVFMAANDAAEPFRLDYRLRHAGGGWRWAIDAASPRFAEDGGFLGYVGSVIDIHERKQAEERQALLAAELDHRVKNILATVQSIAIRTLGRDGASEALVGRIAALAKTHSALSQSSWQGVELTQLAESLVEAYRADGDRVRLDGPPLMLQPKLAQSLSLALNELATNAVKYGALSVPGGRISLRWRVAGGAEPQLRLVWRESGGPPVRSPVTRGFGSALIERSLAYELNAVSRLDFRPEGLYCEIVIPFAEPHPADDEGGLADADQRRFHSS